MGQDSIGYGVIDIVICGVYERTSIKYGPRSERYVHMEAGHVAQNVYLQAVSLGLGTVVDLCKINCNFIFDVFEFIALVIWL
jgi:hypothetical protein